MLSSAKKKYLFAICKLGLEGNQVQSSDIASFLQVKRPSVSKMLKVLSDDGLIEKECYGKITFTRQGLQTANHLYTNYLLLFEYFSEWIHLSAENARHDALICICNFSDEGVEKHILFLLNQQDTEKINLE